MYLPLFHNYLPGNAILWGLGIVYPSCGDQRFLLDVLLYCFALLKIKIFFYFLGMSVLPACTYIPCAGLQPEEAHRYMDPLELEVQASVSC